MKMSRLHEYLLQEKAKKEAFLISNENENTNSSQGNKKRKYDYVVNAKPDTIIVFRLNFKSKRDVSLTKTISGKILNNDCENEMFTVETKNGLQYGVPYDVVVWVKTGDKFPRGVYDEMKRGAVEVAEGQDLELSELEAPEVEYDSEDI